MLRKFYTLPKFHSRLITLNKPYKKPFEDENLSQDEINERRRTKTLDLLIHNDHFDGVFRFWKEMKIVPSTRDYNQFQCVKIFDYFSKSKKDNLLIQVLNQIDLGKMDTVTFNTILGHYCRYNWNVFKFYHDSTKGVRPDLQTFCTLLKYLLDQNVTDRNEWIHHEMEKNGVEKEIVWYSILFKHYISNNMSTEIENLLKRINDTGLKKDPFFYNMLIDYYTKQGKNDLAEATCIELVKQAQDFTPHTFVTVMQLYLKMKKYEDLDRFYHEFLSKYPVTEPVVSIMMKSYGMRGEMKKLEEMFQTLQRKKMTSFRILHVYFYALCVEARYRNRKSPEARQKVRDLYEYVQQEYPNEELDRFTGVIGKMFGNVDKFLSKKE